jgi:hypothetical protein
MVKQKIKFENIPIEENIRNKIKSIQSLSSEDWIVSFYSINPVEDMVGGKVYHVKARTEEEAIKKAIKKFKRMERI